MKDLESEVARNFRTILNDIVRYLCNSLDWLSTLTTKHELCWGIVAACCSKISITTFNFDWLANYFDVVQSLATIYGAYIRLKQGRDENVSLAELPQDVQNCSSLDVQT